MSRSSPFKRMLLKYKISVNKNDLIETFTHKMQSREQGPRNHRASTVNTHTHLHPCTLKYTPPLLTEHLCFTCFIYWNPLRLVFKVFMMEKNSKTIALKHSSLPKNYLCISPSVPGHANLLPVPMKRSVLLQKESGQTCSVDE